MTGRVLSTAGLTGPFCAVFAFGVDLATDRLNTVQVTAPGAVSGFRGSVFAQIALRGHV